MVELEKIGKAIAYLRKRAGFTQKDLADRMGISDKAVSKWERGLGLPDISCLRKLSILLDTDTDSLLSGDVINHDTGWHGILSMKVSTCNINLSTILYDKPLASYLLSYFLLVGIRDILVCCNDEECRWMTNVWGNGSSLGITIHYSTKNVLDALQETDGFSDCDDFLIVNGRSFLFGVDQTRFFQKAMIERGHITVLSLPKKSDNRSEIHFDVNKRVVVTDGEGRVKTQYDYHFIPFVFCPAEMISSIFVGEEILFKEQELYTEVLDRGFVEISIDDPQALSDASNFVRVVQNSCGMEIYSPEEIAWRRGMISMQELDSLAKMHSGTKYGDYLNNLVSDYR